MDDIRRKRWATVAENAGLPTSDIQQIKAQIEGKPKKAAEPVIQFLSQADIAQPKSHPKAAGMTDRSSSPPMKQAKVGEATPTNGIHASAKSTASAMPASKAASS